MSVGAPLGATSDQGKAPTAFRTISEVSSNLDIPQHVLRFWESKFQQVKPLKRGGGRRYYRPEDITLLSSIKDLLYNQGFTIRGVQKLLKENGRVSTPSSSGSSVSMVKPSEQELKLSANVRHEIEGVLSELKSLRNILSQTGL